MEREEVYHVFNVDHEAKGDGSHAQASRLEICRVKPDITKCHPDTLHPAIAWAVESA
jgi:hypothetical protein